MTRWSFIFVFAFMAFGLRAEDQHEIRQFFREIVEATLSQSEAERIAGFQKAFLSHPELVMALSDDDKVSNISKAIGVNLERDLIGRVDDALFKLLETYVKSEHIPAELRNQTAQFVRKNGAVLFSKMPEDLRQEFVQYVPRTMWDRLHGEIESAIANADLKKIPGVEILLGEQAVDIPQIPKREAKELVTLIRGYYERMDLDNRRKTFLSLLTLPETATDSQRLSAVMQESGPVMQKLFQLIGGRIKDPTIASASQDLLQNIRPFSYDEVRIIVEKRYGPIESVFSEFEPTHTAAASVGQVHRAKLKDGEEVMVKVRRPGLLESARNEFRRLHASAESDSTRALIKGLEQAILPEFDFNIEARNLDRGKGYEQHLPKSPTGIAIAKRIQSLPIAEDVLVMERAKGKPLKTYVESEETAEEVALRGKALATLTEEWLRRAIFGDGFAHVDLHKGNLFYDSSPQYPTGYQLTLIDFGSAIQLSSEDAKAYIRLVAGVKTKNPLLIADTLSNFYGIQIRQKKRELQETIKKILEDRSISSREVLSKIFHELPKFGIAISENILQMNRGLMFQQEHLEEVNKKLDVVDPQKKLSRLNPIVIAARAALHGVNEQLWNKHKNNPALSFKDALKISAAVGSHIFRVAGRKIKAGFSTACKTLTQKIAKNPTP